MQAHKINVTADVRSRLPEVLVAYLLKYFDVETAELDAVLTECTLTASEIGGRPIQQVDFLGKQRFVFGFVPVDCKLLVMLYPNHCKVSAVA